MKALNLIQKEIEKKITKVHLRSYEASSIAYEIVSVIKENKLDERYSESLKEKFKIAVIQNDLKSIYITTVKYALKLMRAESLIFEEYNKIYSLFDEIYSLEFLEIFIDNQLQKNFILTMNLFLAEHLNKCKLVAQDRVLDWKKEFSWYKILT